MKNRFLIFAFTLGAIIIRLLPHAPNVAPVGALALLAGTHFKLKHALAATVLTLLLTDSVIGFHPLVPWVYGSYILIAVIAYAMRGKTGTTPLLFLPLVSSFLFYFVTNFGVWASTAMYPKTLAGLIECYTLALPFFRNTLIGDYLFTFGFFSMYCYLKNFNRTSQLIPRATGVLLKPIFTH